MTTDDQLVSYLLGNLPDEEVERLDELSVTDEGFAQRLREAEYELVDAYVRGELAGDVRRRIETVYGSSARGRSRLQFAEALRAITRDRVQTAPAGWPVRAGVSRAMRSWGVPIAATLVMAVAGAWLLTSNARLRRDVQQLESQRDSLAATGEQLRLELASRSQPAPSTKQPPTAMFLLSAPRRDAATVPAVEVPRGAAQITLNVQLESNDFASYHAAVSRAADPSVVWRSADLSAARNADGAVVPVPFPAALGPGRYVLGLVGRARRGADEPIASYPFDIVVK